MGDNVYAVIYGTEIVAKMVVYEFFFCFFAYRLTNVQFLSHDDHDDDHDDDES